jgi:hypothetical protein
MLLGGIPLVCLPLFYRSLDSYMYFNRTSPAVELTYRLRITTLGRET